MRNSRGPRKLGRTSSHRKAMLRNLVTSVLEHERVTTTDARAKEVRPLAERVITYGKRGDLHARRMALRMVRSQTVVRKVFDSVAKRFADRQGGYTRIIKLGRRQGDGAPLSIIELLPDETSRKEAAAASKKGQKKAEKKADKKTEKKAGSAKAKAAKLGGAKPKPTQTQKPGASVSKKKAGGGQKKGRSGQA